MLPNIRLMIAATLAAVLMLICGFGVFAAFRVSHAPLEPVASAASLRLATTDAAMQAMSIAATAPFNNSFDAGPPGGSVAALAYAAPEPAAPSETNVTGPAADDREPTAAESRPATAEPAASGDDATSSSEQTARSEAEPETKPEEMAATAAPVGTTDADSTIADAAPATAKPPEAAPLPAPRREPEVASAAATIEPAIALPDLATKAAEEAEIKAKRAHAARTHHVHKARVVTAASGFESQTTFQTAPWGTPQTPQKAPARIRHTKITSATPASEKPPSVKPASTVPASTPSTSTKPTSTTTADTIPGVGGPFLSAPSR